MSYSEYLVDSACISFNDDWWFLSPDAAKHDIDINTIPAKCKKIQLPHSWNAIGWNYENYKPDEPAGIGWYFKKLPRLDKNKNAIIKFEGISAATNVYLNGKLISKNLGAYKVFEVTLKDIRGDGSDLLAIKVTDKPSVPLLRQSEDPFSSSPRYKLWALAMGSSIYAGGIWRNVWLITSNGALMRTPRIESRMKSLLVNTKVDYDCGNGLLRYSLYDENGIIVAIEDAAPNKIVEIRLNDAKQWSPSAPFLYKLETSLVINDEKVQTIVQYTAFYEFCIRNSEFYFNGKPYFLRGQNGFPHCNVPHDAEYIRRYISRVKDQGVEISRFHTEPPCHAWLDECDRQGIMVIFEMPLHGSFGCYPLGHPEFEKNYIDELHSLVEEYRRHPSIMMWCLGNEIIVSSERDIGLGKNLFDLLENWVDEIRKFDSRPVIANSGGDAAESVSKTVGDVDDVHQYGGWYTENLYDLHNYESYIRKNDMLFQPMICTESVAAYTDNDGRFFAKHDDVRQRKVICQRFGDPDQITPKQCMNLQAFILKEYAEAIWRMRRDDTTVAGYIPFGQYTWFFDPFDKSQSGLSDKPVWDVYRKVMSPVHVQLECWNRHIFKGNCFKGKILLNHENIHLPETADFTIVITLEEKELYRQTATVNYHSRYYEDIELDISNLPAGDHHLTIKAFFNGKCISINDREVCVYTPQKMVAAGHVWIYDPTDKLKKLRHEIETARFCQNLSEIDFWGTGDLLIIGPYAMDRHIAQYAGKLYRWCEAGNTCLVMEQQPCQYTHKMLQTSICVKRSTQPYWSRWARNMVRHSDRADICGHYHSIFMNIHGKDLSWWNGDTYLADAYLRVDSNSNNLKILSGISHGLSDDELMPVMHTFKEQDYNPLIIEYSHGHGNIIFSNLLIGTKFLFEPVARMLLANMIAYGTSRKQADKTEVSQASYDANKCFVQNNHLTKICQL